MDHDDGPAIIDRCCCCNGCHEPPSFPYRPLVCIFMCRYSIDSATRTNFFPRTDTRETIIIKNLSPDAYLFEFMSEPGTAAAAQEANQFKAKLASMKSAHIRQEFGFLLNGISAQVADQDELLELMASRVLRTVTPLVLFLHINTNASAKVDVNESNLGSTSLFSPSLDILSSFYYYFIFFLTLLLSFIYTLVLPYSI